MYDSGKIIVGLIIGLILLSFPFWYNLGTAAAPVPDPKLTAKAKAAGQCIEPKAQMKTSHMKILDEWRDIVVRDGERLYVADDGKQYNMSLQNTCMDCHSSKKEFCDQCHDYLGVKPFCWDCHIEPEEK